MRFLFVGRFEGQGGSHKATIPIALKLRNEGHYVSLSHWQLPAELEIFKQNELFNLCLHQQDSLLKKIIYLTKTSREYDVIIAVSELTVTYACQIAGWINCRPVLGEIQVNLELWIKNNSSSLHYILSKFFYPQLDAVRCVSPELLNFAVSRLKIYPDKVFSIYNPFNLKDIVELAAHQLPQEAQNWFHDPVILCVGRLETQKRFEQAIKALSILKKNHNSLKLVILGEGSQKNQLKQYSLELGLENSVHFAGFYSNPYPFFAASKLFLLCSDYEGSPRVIVDSLAVGCPVIAHDCPFGPADILQQGKCGLLIPNNDPETIAHHINFLLENPQLCSELIAQGKQRSLDFSENLITDKYLEELRKLSLLK